MTNTELVRQLNTASVQCDEMRLRDFGYLFKTAADKIDELLNVIDYLHKASEVYYCHITCPVCGMSLWANTSSPVRMEETE